MNPAVRFFLASVDESDYSFNPTDIGHQILCVVKCDDGLFKSADIREAFLKSAAAGLKHFVELFLTANPQLLDVVNECQDSALSQAAQANHECTVKCLLDLNARISGRIMRKIEGGCICGESARLILSQKPKQDALNRFIPQKQDARNRLIPQKQTCHLYKSEEQPMRPTPDVFFRP